MFPRSQKRDLGHPPQAPIFRSDLVRFKRLIEPRLDEPLPLWMIFPVIFTALYATHFTLLSVPYYWDEAGYYIPAAWDFFRTGSLIPITTLTRSEEHTSELQSFRQLVCRLLLAKIDHPVSTDLTCTRMISILFLFSSSVLF